MKTKIILQKVLLIFILSLLSSTLNIVRAQTDTTAIVPADSVQIANTDTVVVVQTDTVFVAPAESKQKKAKRKDEFIVYAGPNFNSLSTSSTQFESSTEIGYHFGFSYRRGKFFFWQLGARYNAASFEFKDSSTHADSTSFGVNSIDVPITGGINILSVTNRVLGLRAFVSAVPSYALSTKTIEKDRINSFLFYGQAGVGVNVAFFIVDVGYNFGFQDMISSKESKPGQLFVNLGFRF